MWSPSGVAPAYLVYQWTLTGFGRLGWVAACLYMVCGALRLARFNVQTGTKDPRYFVGLPIPAAAVILAVVVLGVNQFEIQSAQAGLVVLVLLYVLSFLKVSTMPYRSLKEVALTPRRSFNFLVAGVLVLSLVAYRPVLMGIFILFTYLASGPVLYIWRLRAKKKAALKESVQAAGNKQVGAGMSESREEGPKDPETLGPWTAPGDFPATFPEKAEKNPGENPGVSVFFLERENGI